MARNKAGLLAPWAYIRRVLARTWGCFPWEVDDAPLDEVLLELKLMGMEARAGAAAATGGGGAQTSAAPPRSAG
jgi:hypothetical protein